MRPIHLLRFEYIFHVYDGHFSFVNGYILSIFTTVKLSKFNKLQHVNALKGRDMAGKSK